MAMLFLMRPPYCIEHRGRDIRYMNDGPETNHRSGVDRVGNLSNAKNNTHHDPLKFVDTLSDQKHIVLFYEELEAARIVEYRYLKDGLLKGQNVIHITPDDMSISSIENEMTNNGIDVESFIKKGLLHIHQVSTTRNDQDGEVKRFENIAKDILDNLRSPSRSLRAVVIHVSEVNTEQQIESKLAVEHSYHSSFHSFGGSLLCSYPVKQIEPKRRGKWIEDILKNHHSAIFVTKPGEGLAFNME
jgi:hypothetical protein